MCILYFTDYDFKRFAVLFTFASCAEYIKSFDFTLTFTNTY